MIINLLPKKSSLFEKYKLDIIVCLLVVMTPVIFVMSLTLLIDQQLSELRQQIAEHEEEIHSYQRMLVINKAPQKVNTYQSYLGATQKIWQAFQNLSSQPVCLTEIKRIKNKLTVNGNMQSVLDLEEYSEKLSNAGVFSSVSFSKISQTNGSFSQAWQMRVIEKLVSPSLQGSQHDIH